MRKTRFLKVSSSIPTDASGLSGEIKIGDTGKMQAIEIPNGTWATANITFQASTDQGTTYLDVYDADGNEVTATVGGTNRIIAVDPTIFAGFSHIKLRSGTTATPVDQTSSPTVNVLVEANI